MQDIVFYVAARETLGRVREYSNMRNSAAPLLTLGVAVCLRMRLFEDIEVSTPYPVASFSGITDWKWRMDADFDRSTSCKLVADTDGITVQSVTDTINGETMSFTEIVIPISNMNTRELVAWLGTDKVKTGLTGELVGYDNEGHPTFVLQIEDFSVRNRLAGLNEETEFDPIPVDQEIVTHPIAEQMIQTAVSSLDAAKQDKLATGNAGTGISISSAGVISTENVPQSAVSGLSASLSSKQDKLNSDNAGTGVSISNNGVISVDSIPQAAVNGLVAALYNKQNSLSIGYGLAFDDDRISVERYRTFLGPYSNGTVTLQAGYMYKILATSSAVTLNAENIPNNSWGLEGHAEIFVANTGYVQTGANVVLADALEPDSVNNCTIRFHDGNAIVSVEDHVAGFVVKNTSLYNSGSLYYGLDSDGNEYICVDASLNGQTLDLNGIEVFSTKHIVGNGYENTFVTGSADVISPGKLTLAALTLSGATVSGASDIRLADVKMENSVVSAGGTLFLDTPTEISYMSGGVQVDGVAGRLACTEIQSGGVVVVGDKLARIVSAGEVFSANNVIFESATQPNEGPDSRYWGGGHVLVLHMPETSGSPAVAHLSGCTIRDGVGEYNTAVCCNSGCSASFTDCAITGNTCAGHGVVTAMGTVDLSSCTIAGNIAAIGVLTVTGSMSLVSCTVSGNTCTAAGGQTILITEGGTATLEGCKLYDGNGVFISSGSNTAIFKGSNYFQSLFSVWPGSATVLIEEGATVDLTGNSYASPINPGAGVVVAGGDSTKSCTIINSAGASVSIAGGTYTKINNDGTTN